MKYHEVFLKTEWYLLSEDFGPTPLLYITILLTWCFLSRCTRQVLPSSAEYCKAVDIFRADSAENSRVYILVWTLQHTHTTFKIQSRESCWEHTWTCIWRSIWGLRFRFSQVTRWLHALLLKRTCSANHQLQRQKLRKTNELYFRVTVELAHWNDIYLKKTRYAKFSV